MPLRKRAFAGAWGARGPPYNRGRFYPPAPGAASARMLGACGAKRNARRGVQRRRSRCTSPLPPSDKMRHCVLRGMRLRPSAAAADGRGKQAETARASGERGEPEGGEGRAAGLCAAACACLGGNPRALCGGAGQTRRGICGGELCGAVAARDVRRRALRASG